MQELWNEVCFIVDRYRQANSSENNFQIEAENIFEKLGWSRFKGEVISQESINVGSAHTVRPDIIVSNGQENLFVVELKKPSAGFIDRNTDQLVSYMRLLRLNHGILLGDSIRVLYDRPDDKDDPIEVIDIPFTCDNADGAKLFETIKRGDFALDNLNEYCNERLRLLDVKKNANKQIRFLCSEKGKKFIAESVRKAIADDESEQIAALVIKELSFSAIQKSKPASTNLSDASSHNMLNPEGKLNQSTARTEYRKYEWNPNEKVSSLELHPYEGELFQDYVKRTMHLAFANNMLSDEEIERLQDLNYSKRTFGLSYPLLVDSREKIYDKTGKPRYWTKEHFGKFYCCSQWWRARIPQHEEMFSKWVAEINRRNSQ